MALFGRRRDKQAAAGQPGHDHGDDEYGDDYGDDYGEPGGEFEPSQGDLEALSGPFDESEEPDDGLARLDLGSLRLPVPEGAQLQVEMEQPGMVKAIHVLMPGGQMTLNAYAAPRSGGLWDEVCGELAAELKANGASVRSATGEWGQELMAMLGEMSLRFIGVNGPRWMLRGVVAGPPEQAAQAAHGLRTLIRGTVVIRGTAPIPVREPLPIQLPEEIVQHIEAQGG